MVDIVSIDLREKNPRNRGQYVMLHHPREAHTLLFDQNTNLLDALDKIPDHASLAATNPRAHQKLETHTSSKSLFILGNT